MLQDVLARLLEFAAVEPRVPRLVEVKNLLAVERVLQLLRLGKDERARREIFIPVGVAAVFGGRRVARNVRRNRYERADGGAYHGKGDGTHVRAPHDQRTSNANSPVEEPCAFATVSLTAYAPAPDGVPEIVPTAGSIVSPAGKPLA